MLLINFVSIAGEEQDLILKRRALNIFQRKNALKEIKSISQLKITCKHQVVARCQSLTNYKLLGLASKS